MVTRFPTARIVVQNARCAVLTTDERSFQLGYFLAPRHEWVFVASFANEATARRAFQLYDLAGPRGGRQDHDRAAA